MEKEKKKSGTKKEEGEKKNLNLAACLSIYMPLLSFLSLPFPVVFSPFSLV